MTELDFYVDMKDMDPPHYITSMAVKLDMHTIDLQTK